MPHSGRAMAGTRVSPESRAEDLHAAFSDPDVAVVLAAIGGDHAPELVPHLDYQLIRANPQAVPGLLGRDGTALGGAQARRPDHLLRSGAAARAGRASDGAAVHRHGLRAAWFGSAPLRFVPATSWTDEFLDWEHGQDRTRPRELRPSGGWVTIRDGPPKVSWSPGAWRPSADT